MLVTDVQGRFVVDQQLQRTRGEQRIKINTSDLEAGTYLLHLLAPDGKSTKRFVVFR